MFLKDIEQRIHSGRTDDRSAVITADPLVALGEKAAELDRPLGIFSAMTRTASPKLTLLNGTGVKSTVRGEALDPVRGSRDLDMRRRSHEPIVNVVR